MRERDMQRENKNRQRTSRRESECMCLSAHTECPYTSVYVAAERSHQEVESWLRKLLDLLDYLVSP